MIRGPRIRFRSWLVALLFIPLLACLSHGPSRKVADDSFRFSNWDGPPVDVLVHRPQHWNPDSPIVFVLHGASRDAEKYFSRWKPMSDRYGFLLILPHFDQKRFPGPEGYALGGLPDADEAWPPSAGPVFDIIEPIFQATRKRVGATRTRFRLFGHSAGAQFAQRYLFLRPDAPVERAVISAAGWYTMPDRDAAWPYGLRGTAIGVAQLARSFALDVTILLGDQDIERNPGNLRRTADARAEGRNRVERGVEFYQRSRAVAQAEGMAFRWRVQMVPGAGHDSILSVEAAAPILAN